MCDKDSAIDDAAMFRQETSDVIPIKTTNRVSFKPPPRQVASHNEIFSDPVVKDIFSAAPIYEDCPDILNFSRSGIQHSVLKHLRQGKMPVEQGLDLHGLTIQQARQELIKFLNDCTYAELRHVVIVHGKGYRSKGNPVIKPMINRWLRVAPNVLAFCSALPKDGGNGAVYVLLGRNKLP